MGENETTFTFRIPAKLRERAKAIAQSEDRSEASLVRIILEEGITAREKAIKESNGSSDS